MDWAAQLKDYFHVACKFEPEWVKDFQIVECETQASDKVLSAMQIVEPEVKACYNNSFDMICQLECGHYCLGYTMSSRVPIPIEHAWIEYEGKYYDPTFLHLGVMSEPEDCGYARLYKLTRGELLQFLDAQFEGGYSSAGLPDIYSWTRVAAARANV